MECFSHQQETCVGPPKSQFYWYYSCELDFHGDTLTNLSLEFLMKIVPVKFETYLKIIAWQFSWLRFKLLLNKQQRESRKQPKKTSANIDPKTIYEQNYPQFSSAKILWLLICEKKGSVISSENHSALKKYPFWPFYCRSVFELLAIL